MEEDKKFSMDNVSLLKVQLPKHDIDFILVYLLLAFNIFDTFF